MAIDEEEWRPVVGWEGFYSVSSHGRVRSEARNYLRHGRPVSVREREMKPWGAGPDRRPAVVLQSMGRTWKGCVRILVCEAFHGPRPEGHEAAHFDGDFRNNFAYNLRWATPAENAADKIRHGTSRRGLANSQCKLSDDDVRDIRASTEIHRIVAARYGVSKSPVGAIKRREDRAHV